MLETELPFPAEFPTLASPLPVAADPPPLAPPPPPAPALLLADELEDPLGLALLSGIKGKMDSVAKESKHGSSSARTIRGAIVLDVDFFGLKKYKKNCAQHYRLRSRNQEITRPPTDV